MNINLKLLQFLQQNKRNTFICILYYLKEYDVFKKYIFFFTCFELKLFLGKYVAEDTLSLTPFVYRNRNFLLSSVLCLFQSPHFVVPMINSIVFFSLLQFTLWHFILYLNKHSYSLINVLSCIMSNGAPPYQLSLNNKSMKQNCMLCDSRSRGFDHTVLGYMYILLNIYSSLLFLALNRNLLVHASKNPNILPNVYVLQCKVLIIHVLTCSQLY